MARCSRRVRPWLPPSMRGPTRPAPAPAVRRCRLNSAFLLVDSGAAKSWNADWQPPRSVPAPVEACLAPALHYSIPPQMPSCEGYRRLLTAALGDGAFCCSSIFGSGPGPASPGTCFSPGQRRAGPCGNRASAQRAYQAAAAACGHGTPWPEPCLQTCGAAVGLRHASPTRQRLPHAVKYFAMCTRLLPVSHPGLCVAWNLKPRFSACRSSTGAPGRSVPRAQPAGRPRRGGASPLAGRRPEAAAAQPCALRHGAALRCAARCHAAGAPLTLFSLRKCSSTRHHDRCGQRVQGLINSIFGLP